MVLHAGTRLNTAMTEICYSVADTKCYQMCLVMMLKCGDDQQSDKSEARAGFFSCFQTRLLQQCIACFATPTGSTSSKLALQDLILIVILPGMSTTPLCSCGEARLLPAQLGNMLGCEDFAVQTQCCADMRIRLTCACCAVTICTSSRRALASAILIKLSSCRACITLAFLADQPLYLALAKHACPW